MKKADLQGYRKNFIKFLSVFMVVFPWITYLNLSRLSEVERTVFSGYEGVIIDFFIKQKGNMLVVAAAICLLWFIGERFLPENVDNNVPLLKGKNKWLFILCGIFCVGTVASTLLSKYQANALKGSPTVGEGLWVLLGYVIVILAFYNYFAYEYAFGIVKKAVSAMSIIAVILTLVEWFYKPLLEIGLVQMLVAPAKYAEVVASMKASVFSSAISLTFYNPGYYGGFVCILLPFVLNYFLQAKKVAEKVWYGVLIAGLLFGVVASNTTTALYIAIAEVVLVIVAYLVCGSVKKPEIVFVAVGVALVLVLAGTITGNSFLNVFSNSNSASGTVVEERFEVEDIQMKGNKLVLVGKEAKLAIIYEKDKLLFLDEAGNTLKPAYVDDVYVFSEHGLENLRVSVARATEDMEDVQLCVMIDAGYQSSIDFFFMKTGKFVGVGQNATPLADISDAGTPESLKAFYGLFTGRGYTWVNSLPILKDTWLIGKGPGNFSYYFKQFDYVGLLDTHKTVKQVIDKPHNAYLQYAIELGWPAAIAFWGIFVGALVKAVKGSWTKRKQLLNMENGAFHLAAIASVIGFLGYSFINDSMVTVTPVMCMIVGILLASCYMMEKEGRR